MPAILTVRAAAADRPPLRNTSIKTICRSWKWRASSCYGKEGDSPSISVAEDPFTQQTPLHIRLIESPFRTRISFFEFEFPFSVSKISAVTYIWVSIEPFSPSGGEGEEGLSLALFWSSLQQSILEPCHSIPFLNPKRKFWVKVTIYFAEEMKWKGFDFR